jgi:parvulin-like peptidyl-prolyl isomerase
MNEENHQSILVNGEEVGEALIEQELQVLRERYAQKMSWEEIDRKQAKIESDARENAVERVLLTQKAREVVQDIRTEEIDARFMALKNQHGGEEEFGRRFELSSEGEAKVKADIEDGVRLEKYFDRICADVARPVEADSRAYYNEHPDEFKQPEMVHAAHIVQHPTPDAPLEKIYAELLNVRERLKAGEAFNALAAEYSHCQDDGFDLGYFARGQMVPAFEEVAFSTAVGEFSDVFQTEFGYHILTVFDHRPEERHAYEEVRYDIESMLFDERKNDAIGAVADELRAAADIQNLEIVEA